jgi:hypothetical protein
MGLMAGKAKYKNYSKIRQFIHRVLVPAYLANGHFPETGMIKR